MDAVLVGLVLPEIQNHSLAALAEAAGAAGHSVAIAPFGGFADIDSVARVVARERPRVVGISMQTTETALASATLADVLRRRGYRGVIVAGGHFATLNAADLVREVSAIDAVVRFAGEAALRSLLAKGMDQDLASIPGLVFRDAGGEVREGAAPVVALSRRSFVADPAELPVHLGFAAADLVASRGCAAHCGYCCVAGLSDLAAAHGSRAEQRTVAEIGDEIAALFHERGVRVFNFMDDNLLPMAPDAAARWVGALSGALAARRVGRIAFSLQLRADVCTPAVVGALADLGLARAYVGIDGYSGRQLVALGRDAPADAGPDALAALGRAGVFSVCNALLIGPTFDFATVVGEIEGLARVAHAPVHLLPIDVRAGSTYFERVRKRGLLEGGTLCWRYRFADPRTALMAEALLGLPTRLEEYSVPVALYDLGYNLGVARRLLPDADVSEACAIFADVTARWNIDQIWVLRAAAAAAATGEREAVLAFRDREGPRVRRLDDELRALSASALRSIESAASRAQGRAVRSHARGSLISAVALSLAMAACNRDALQAQPPGGPRDAPIETPAGPPPTDGTIVISDAAQNNDAGYCPPGLTPQPSLWGTCCGAAQLQVTFDAAGVATAVQVVDGTDAAANVIDCVQSMLARYCYPSFAGTTQPLMSTHCWVA
jgi:hypothetical protein